jgi:hypothetical protein
MSRLPVWVVVVLTLALVLGLTAPAFAAETAKGKIKSVSADQSQFVVTDSTGKDWTFQMNDKSKVSVNNQAGRIADLKVGEEVTVKYEKQGEKLLASEIICARK